MADFSKEVRNHDVRQIFDILGMKFGDRVKAANRVVGDAP